MASLQILLIESLYGSYDMFPCTTTDIVYIECIILYNFVTHVSTTLQFFQWPGLENM